MCAENVTVKRDGFSGYLALFSVQTHVVRSQSVQDGSQVCVVFSDCFPVDDDVV